MEKEFVFSSDYIEITTKEYDSIIYTPIYSENKGLYLYTEDEKPIKNIMLINSGLIINYLDGENRLMDNIVMSITIDDKSFKRRMNEGISGSLFKYSVIDAHFYELEVEKAYDYELYKSITRKRSL